MHASVREFVAKQIVELSVDAPNVDVIEVGSYDENGTVRNLFEGARSYTGIDMREGPGVDIAVDVMMLHSGPWTSWHRRADVILCLEMLEHCLNPWIALVNMAGMLRTGGSLLLTTRGFETGAFPVHLFPDDYYRFSKSAITGLLMAAELAPLYVGDDPEQPGVFAVAVS